MDVAQLAGSPVENLMELFRQAVRWKLPLNLEAYRWAKRQAQRFQAPGDGGNGLRGWLFEIIREEDSQVRTLRALYDTGVLPAVIPELRLVHALVQHDAFHLHPVHEHHLQSFAEMKKLLEGEYDASHPEVREWLEGLENGEVLLLASLIHDVGKGGGRGHAQRGAEMAPAIAARLGLQDEEAELLGFLVAHHVLLTDSAARRDLTDREMIEQCTGVIGSVDRLKMLMLHSFADMRATGPRAWEYWQSLPMGALYQTLVHRLEKGEPDERTVASRLTLLRRKVGEHLAGQVEPGELDAHFEQLSPRYLLSVTPEEAVSHLTLERRLGTSLVCWQVQEKQGMWELTLTSSQPYGLLARVAGILTLHGLDIRKARTHTKINGVAIQIFEVAATESPMDVSWERVMTDLEKTLQGKLALDYRLALQGAGKGREERRVPGRADEVVVDNESSEQDTIIEVYATDRRGLLYAITRALVDLQLDISLAKISTRMDQVADIFYVRTRAGQRVADPEQIEEIRQALLFSLQ
jgi:[protein-PII] uridylyltransferase